MSEDTVEELKAKLLQVTNQRDVSERSLNVLRARKSPGHVIDGELSNAIRDFAKKMNKRKRMEAALEAAQEQVKTATVDEDEARLVVGERLHDLSECSDYALPLIAIEGSSVVRVELDVYKAAENQKLPGGIRISVDKAKSL